VCGSGQPAPNRSSEAVPLSVVIVCRASDSVSNRDFYSFVPSALLGCCRRGRLDCCLHFNSSVWSVFLLLCRVIGLNSAQKISPVPDTASCALNVDTPALWADLSPSKWFGPISSN